MPYRFATQVRLLIQTGRKPTPRFQAAAEIFALGVRYFEKLEG